MYEVLLFKGAREKSLIKDYILELKVKANSSKSARITLNKIYEYIGLLEKMGTRAGEPYIKHIEGNIWELRPASDRMFFFSWINKKIVLLHYFHKKSQKTPKREIEQAHRNLVKFLEEEQWEKV